jgi:hypothetical protein
MTPKQQYQLQRQTRRDPLLTTCRHFIHQLGDKATSDEWFECLSRAAEEQGLIIFVEQHSQGTSFRLIKRGEANVTT